MTVCFHGYSADHLQVALLLIKHGADVAAEDDEGRNTVAMHAAQNRNTSMFLDFSIHLLMRKEENKEIYKGSSQREFLGKQVNRKDKWGRTPLHLALAVRKRCPLEETLDKVRILLRAGADPELEDKNGKRPLTDYLEGTDNEMVS
jgi:ankyrin repeat protein